MTDEEIAKAIRDLIRQDTVPLSRLPALLESYGYLDGEDDRIGKRRALVAMMRKILQDPDVADLLRMTMETHALRVIQDLFDIDSAHLLTEAYWNAYAAKRRELEKKVEELRQATYRKVTLLGFLAERLVRMKCDEEYELPALREEVLPPIQVP